MEILFLRNAEAPPPSTEYRDRWRRTGIHGRVYRSNATGCAVGPDGLVVAGPLVPESALPLAADEVRMGRVGVNLYLGDIPVGRDPDDEGAGSGRVRGERSLLGRHVPLLAHGRRVTRDVPGTRRAPRRSPPPRLP